jgi:ornithine cyclodeaminase/alanine dehydrogenase-like protein (mu-crystallin family)
VLIHGRNPDKARALCDELHARGLHARPASAEEATGADIIITTTPAATPILDAARVREGAHMTGVGTDMPHKNELPAALFGRAQLIATDDHDQCLDHGDFGHAVRARTASETGDTAAGLLSELLGGTPNRGNRRFSSSAPYGLCSWLYGMRLVVGAGRGCGCV